MGKRGLFPRMQTILIIEDEPLERMPEPPIWVLLLCIVSVLEMKRRQRLPGRQGAG